MKLTDLDAVNGLAAELANLDRLDRVCLRQRLLSFSIIEHNA